MENIKRHKNDYLVSVIFWSSILEVLKKILALNVFLNSKKMYLVKFDTILKVLEHQLWLTTSSDFADKKTIITKFDVIENLYSDLSRMNIGWKSNKYWSFLAWNIIAQNVDLIYKRTNTMYLKILAWKCEEFLGKRYLLC